MTPLNRPARYGLLAVGLAWMLVAVLVAHPEWTHAALMAFAGVGGSVLVFLLVSEVVALW